VNAFEPREDKSMMGRIKSAVKTNLIAGLIALVPLLATVYALVLLVKWTDKLLLLIPEAFRPDNYLPFPLPGLGLVLAFVVLFLAGFLVRNYLGRKLVSLGEWLMSYIPFVNPLYRAVKQLIETLLSGSTRDFKRVVLIEYPRKGVYGLAFVTGVSTGEIQRKTEHRCINVFVPTTPNPTSGYYLILPEEDVIELEMTVEDAFKVLISGGIINPEDEYIKGRAQKRPEEAGGSE
jgi:uncharacterized membrane protein